MTGIPLNLERIQLTPEQQEQEQKMLKAADALTAKIMLLLQAEFVAEDGLTSTKDAAVILESFGQITTHFIRTIEQADPFLAHGMRAGLMQMAQSI